MNEKEWVHRYNTELSPENEALFQRWAQRQSRTAGRNVLDDLHDYDLRGYWSGGGHLNQGGGQHPSWLLAGAGIADRVELSGEAGEQIVNFGALLFWGKDFRQLVEQRAVVVPARCEA
jgi:hypothetical protein